MKYDKQVCVDIILIGTPHEEIFIKTRDNIFARRTAEGKEKGAIYEQKSGLRGQEKQLLTGMANEYINGEIRGIDQILDDGINVSANISFQEFHRLNIETQLFRVKSSIDI